MMLRVMTGAAMLMVPVLASAQTPTGRTPDRVRNVTLTGNEQCPKSTGDEIVVCSRINPDEQFRIPKPLRDSAEPAARNQAWANRTKTAETISRQAAGLPDTCSPVGTGGQTGCTLAWNRAYAAERRAQIREEESTPGTRQPARTSDDDLLPE